MYSKRSLYLIAAVLIAESIAIVAVHSRLPRAARSITAGINIVAALGMIVLAKQKTRS